MNHQKIGNNLVQQENEKHEPCSMLIESNRLKTFKEWPHEFIKPKDLASAGLFYVKTLDIVQCAYCNGRIYDWEKGDIPLEEHHKYFPDCSRLRKSPRSVLVYDTVDIKSQLC